MKLLILGQAVTEPKNYRGVDRWKPFYVNDLADIDHVNQLFFWSTEVHDRGYLDDLEKAQELVRAYAELEPPQIFEIVEITYNNEKPDAKNGLLLGFDIGSYTNSVLSWGMNYCGLETKPSVVQPLICLIQKYFQPRLNAYGLFLDYNTAVDCLACMKNLHQVVPHLKLWEMDIREYLVLGIYKLS